MDRREEQVKEARLIYHGSDDLFVKIQALKVISSIDREREELLGITGINVKEMELLKRVEALEEFATDYQKTIGGVAAGP